MRIVRSSEARRDREKGSSRLWKRSTRNQPSSGDLDYNAGGRVGSLGEHAANRQGGSLHTVQPRRAAE